MAVLEHFGVEILVDGETCPEYEDNDDPKDGEMPAPNSSHIFKYIEVMPGAQFVVKIKMEGRVDFKGADYIGSTSSWMASVFASRSCEGELTGKYMREQWMARFNNQETRIWSKTSGLTTLRHVSLVSQY